MSNFEQAMQGASPTAITQPFGKNAQANNDFQNLTSDLQTGDLTSAQKAFASLQNDLKTASISAKSHVSHDVTAAAPSLASVAGSMSDGLNTIA